MSDTSLNTVRQDNLRLFKLCSLCQKALDDWNDTYEKWPTSLLDNVLCYQDLSTIIAAAQSDCMFCRIFLYSKSGECVKEFCRYSQRLTLSNQSHNQSHSQSRNLSLNLSYN